MRSEQRRTRIRTGAVAVILVACVVVTALFLEPEWGQAVTQAAVALVAAVWALSRSRPRVTLTLGLRGMVYLDLENIGKRTARQVRVRCTPPFPMHHDRVLGPEVAFGDMEPGQRYEIALNTANADLVQALEDTVFEVSFDATWGTGRARSTVRVGGSGLLTVSSDDYSTPVGRLARSVEEVVRKLESMERDLSSAVSHLRPVERGGRGIEMKTCGSCGWDHFFVDHAIHWTRFRCANCETEFDSGCECGERWCEHAPAPRQCTAGR